MANQTKVNKLWSANTGSANTFSWSGGFEVFKSIEVEVYLDDVKLTYTTTTINESAAPREYSVDTAAKTIHIGGADLTTGDIIIQANTDVESARAVYQGGSSVASGDLNSNQTQLLRKLSENQLSDATSFTTGNTAPENPGDGDVWYDSVGGRAYVYYVDIDSGQWVEASPPFSMIAATDSTNVTYEYEGGTARTTQSKLSDVVNVRDFGVLGDGTTDNTGAYATLISKVPEGTTIEWGPGTYRGRFESTKAYHLKGGPNVILKPPTDTDTTNSGVIYFYGTEEAAVTLSAQPTFGSTSISHSTGTLAVGDIVKIWDGHVRPSDSQAVNFELLKVRTATAGSTTGIEGTILSNQTAGTYTYVKINPVKNISIQDFKIELGTTSTVHGVWVFRGENVRINNIHLTGGKGTSIYMRDIYNCHTTNTSRTNCNSTVSGYGYHYLNYIVKWSRVEHTRGHVTRHVVDNDSTYHLSVRDAYSSQAGGAPYVITHNSFGGFQHWENIYIDSSVGDQYGIVAAGAGLGENTAAKRAAEILRNIIIKNYYEDSNQDSSDYNRASVDIQYQCKNIQLNGITVIENGTLTGDAIGDGGQKAIRFSGPIGGNSSFCNIHSEGRPIVFQFDSDASTGKHTYSQDFPRSGETLTIRDVSCRNNIRKMFWFKTPTAGDTGAYYSYYDIRNAYTEASSASTAFGTNGANWHSYLHMEGAPNGTGRFELDQYPDGMGTGANKVVVNAAGFNLHFTTAFSSMSSSLTHVGNKLTQSDMISAGSPAGRYLRTAGGAVTAMEKPCGYGQVAKFQCEGATTFDVSAINASSGNADLGTHDGGDFVTAAGDFITLVPTTTTDWRIYKSGQYTDSAW